MQPNEDYNNSGEALSRKILTDLFKEGETIGTAAVVIQVPLFAHVYFLDWEYWKCWEVQ